MESVNLPPGNRVPINTAGMAVYPVEGYMVASWGPLPDGQGPSTEVHLLITLRGMAVPLAMRLKSAAAVDMLVAALQRHRADVWPNPGAGDR